MKVLFAIAFVLLHLLAIALWPAHAMLASYTFLVAAPLLGVMIALHRCRIEGFAPARGWSLAAISLLLWSLGMISSLRADLFLLDPSQVPGESMLLYILYGVPITYAIATIGTDRGSRVQRGVDALLAVVLGYLYFVLTFSWTTLHGAASAQSATMIADTFDMENAFLAVTTVIRYFGSDGRARHLFRTLSIYACLYALCAAYYNHHVALGVAPDIGTYYDAVIDLPFLVFGMVAWNSPLTAAARKTSMPIRFVRSGSPLLLPLAVLTLSLLLLYQRQHTNLGIAGVVVAVLGYGLRSLLSQVRRIETEDLLRQDHRTLAQLAMHDALTGALNRRAFDDAIEREWRIVQRGNGDEVISLALIDIDLFKQYNDSYGHPAGDDCLRLVAAELQKSLLRPTDMLARYGGEEFVMILPGARLADACAATTRACDRINRLSLPHLASPFGQVTVSAGVACSSSMEGGAIESLLALADRAFYEAKHKGRNRVEQAV